jgi:hypothetical protein
MQTFNQSLLKLTQDGTVEWDEALNCSTNPNDLKLMLKGIGGGGAASALKQDSRPLAKPGVSIPGTAGAGATPRPAEAPKIQVKPKF